MSSEDVAMAEAGSPTPAPAAAPIYPPAPAPAATPYAPPYASPYPAPATGYDPSYACMAGGAYPAAAPALAAEPAPAAAAAPAPAAGGTASAAALAGVGAGEGGDSIIGASGTALRGGPSMANRVVPRAWPPVVGITGELDPMQVGCVGCCAHCCWLGQGLQSHGIDAVLACASRRGQGCKGW